MGRIGWLFSRRNRYDELSATIHEHLEEKIADLMDRGMTQKQAELAARRHLGNVARIEERGREVWSIAWLKSIAIDLKYALRQLLKSPGVTLVAIATLALGTGSCAAVFTLTSAIVLKSLPVPHPERLVTYDLRDGDRMRGVSGPFYKLLRQRQSTSVDLMAWANLAWMKDEKIAVRSGSQSSLEDIQFLSGNSFGVLELQPYLGRGFGNSDEDAPVSFR
jgi:hypothetical protein